MKIKLTSIMVEDQAHALAFYCDVLGFQKKQDFPSASTAGSPSSRPKAPTTPAGPVLIARFADTCGNLIQLHQLVSK